MKAMIKIMNRFSGNFLVALLGLLVSGANGQTVGFTNGFEIENWEKSEMTEGTTEFFGTFTDGDGVTQSAQFNYVVNLGVTTTGVPERFADFTVVAPVGANITFNWEYTGNHAWWEAYQQFHITVNGEIVASPLPESKSVGNYAHAGFGAAVTVAEGDTLGFRIGGRNFDSNSFINGTLTVSNFQFEVLASAPLELFVSQNEVAPGSLDFEWPSRAGKVYDLKSSTDLSIPVENWEVWDGQLDVPATDGPTTRIEAVATGGEKRFFVVVEKPGSA